MGRVTRLTACPAALENPKDEVSRSVASVLLFAAGHGDKVIAHD